MTKAAHWKDLLLTKMFIRKIEAFLLKILIGCGRYKYIEEQTCSAANQWQVGRVGGDFIDWGSNH